MKKKLMPYEVKRYDLFRSGNSRRTSPVFLVPPNIEGEASRNFLDDTNFLPHRR